MPLIVTRPRPDGDEWLRRLQQANVDARLVPLIDIVAADAAPIRDAWARLGAFRAVMFVSGNAVRHFFPASGGIAFGPRAWAPGPGTADALRLAGVAPGSIDSPASDAAQFDSEALWLQVQQQVASGDRILLVRGGDEANAPAGRDWLARQVEARGGAVESVVAYARRRPQWTPAQVRQAESALRDGSTWLLSSSEAVGHLRALLPHAAFDQASAIATHPRIAAAAKDAGFGRVRECRPALADVLACLQSPA